MSQIEFDHGGVTYRADQLDAFKQLHVSRKLAPMLSTLLPIFAKLKDGGESAMSEDIGAFAIAAQPFADAIAGMAEADVEYLVKTCLSVVKRKQGDAWSPLLKDGVLMFSDLGLDHMLPLVVRVLRHSLGNFMQGLFGSQQAPATQGSIE